MSGNRETNTQTIKNLGWSVTFAGMGINLALGILYAWSVIGKGIPEEWDWSQADRSWPYSVACLVFSLVMVPAGRMQDVFGPRVVAMGGGVLVGLGMIIARFTTTPLGYILGFGVLAGAGIGFGFASATPPAVKWFPAAKTGMVAGIVVSGFGLASVYAAPLSQWLIGRFGLPAAVMSLGIAFLVVVVGLAQFLKTPPKGYVPVGTPPKVASQGPQKKEDYLPREMLRTWQFYVLWFMYACGAGAGLMIISKLATIASVQANLQLGFVLVAVLAVGNGAGRIVAGMLSDKIGRKATMFLCFVMQAVLIALLSQATVGSVLSNGIILAVISALIGANYGANLSLFPSVTKDYYGLKNFGMNYGLIFTSWGVGGFMLALLAGKVYDATQSFNFAYYCSAALLIVAAIVTFLVKPPHHNEPEADKA
ncbi:MAG TPA: oxalate:formate antiporter [Planctomycetaceae bacterium]|nr:oxalate:formate antiporter [Planctomycetaceae bacterium]